MLIALSSNAPQALSIEIPAMVKKSLIDADNQLTFAGSCAELHPQLGLDAEFETRQDRFLKASRETTGIWGREWDFYRQDDGSRPACKKQHVLTALAAVDAALDKHAEAFGSEALGLQHGVWLGALKLCNRTVAKSEVVVEENFDEKALKIILTDEAKAMLAQRTRHSVRYPIAIRLSGLVVLEPLVHEPIESGEVHLSPMDEGEMELAIAEISKAC